MKKTVLVTGGAGFIGSHYVRFLLRNDPDVYVVNVDALTYSGNMYNLNDIKGNPRHTFIQADLASKIEVEKLFENEIHQIIHFAAESHVDRSIAGRDPFIQSNILGTYHLLEAILDKGIEKFVHISTDEVYGSIPVGMVSEAALLKPGNPYSASKASSDLLCLSYFNTYQLPITITRCTNNYGPNQYPEKLIPRSISLLRGNKPISIFGDGSQERDWLHVLDHVRAVDEVRKHGANGEVYNIGAEHPISNLKIAHLLIEMMGKSTNLIEHVQDRLGHDIRYSLDTAKIKDQLEWKPTISFRDGLKETVNWYMENDAWWLTVQAK